MKYRITNQPIIYLVKKSRHSYTERTNLHCTIKILKEQSSFGTIKIKGKREMGEDINVCSDLFHQRQYQKHLRFALNIQSSSSFYPPNNDAHLEN